MEIYWLEQVAADVPSDDDWLSAEELQRLAALKFPKRRTDWRLGRWTAKRAVASVSGISPSTEGLRRIIITAAESGEPIVTLESDQQSVSISISHRAGRALCAAGIGSVPIGCDLEVVEPKSDSFLGDYFTTGEQVFVAGIAQDIRPLAACLLWSAKESALKALHVGLRADTRSVVADTTSLQTAIQAGGAWQELRVTGNKGIVFQGWWRCESGMVRTIVAARTPTRLIGIRA